MPANSHLQWIDMQFGGLWTSGDSSVMPANKAQVMSGCHPQPAGGLRAFLKPADTLPGSGIQYGSDEVAIGFGATHKAATTQAASSTFFLVTVDGTQRMELPGAATDYASTPDHASLDVAGDIDIRAKVAADDWTPTAQQVLVSNRAGPFAITGYELSLNATTGRPVLIWGNGAAAFTDVATAATGFTDGTVGWVRATLDVNNGAGGHTTTFYTSTDGETWTPLGATVVTAGTTTIAASSTDLNVGRRPDATLPFAGKVYRVEVLDGIAGTLVAAPDFTIQDPGDTVFTDTLGRVWTLAGSAVIEERPAPNLDDWQVWKWEGDESPSSWYRFTAADAAAGAIWEGASTGLLTPPATQPQFALYGLQGVHTVQLGLSIRDVAATESGLYNVNPDSTGAGTAVVRNTTVANNAFGASAVLEHQSRLVIGYQHRIYYSSPGDEDFTAPGSGFVILTGTGILVNLTFDLYDGGWVSWMVSVPPGDLIVATRDGSVYNIQGDLNDPTVRLLGRWTTNVSQEAVNTPHGVFFMLPNQGVVALGLDGTVQPLSQDILPSIWNLKAPVTGLGQLAATEQFLFTPNQHTTAAHSNGPLVYDFASRAWFTAVHTDVATIPNPRLMLTSHDARNSGVWVVSGASPEGTSDDYIWQFRVGGSDGASLSTEQRAHTWEYKSAPLREPGGRRLIIREVQIPAHAFNGASTLDVTINGTTQQATLPAGRSLQTFLFREQEDMLDITVKAKSNDTAVEAPMIEGIRAGWLPGSLI